MPFWLIGLLSTTLNADLNPELIVKAQQTVVEGRIADVRRGHCIQRFAVVGKADQISIYHETMAFFYNVIDAKLKTGLFLINQRHRD